MYINKKRIKICLYCVMKVIVFCSTFVIWYLIGACGYPNESIEFKLSENVFDLISWSFISGNFHYILISSLFGILFVFLLDWILINRKYFKEILWGCKGY